MRKNSKKVRFHTKKTKFLFTIWMTVCVVCGVISMCRPDEVYAGHSDRVIKVGYIDAEGFIEKNEDGTYSGYGVEYLKEISKYTNWKYEFIYDSWKNHMQALQDGEIDLLMQVQKTEEREENYLFSKCYIGTEANILYTRVDRTDLYYEDYENFDGLRIAGIKSTRCNMELEELAKKENFSYVLYEKDTQEECFQALEKNEVDAVAAGNFCTWPNCKIICRLGVNPYYFITNKENSELMQQLDEAMEQIMAVNPCYSMQLYENYFDSKGVNNEISFTKEEMEYIEQVGSISVGIFQNLRPNSYISDDGKIEGIVVDIVKLIEEKSGIKLELQLLESGQNVPDFLEQNPDAIMAGVMHSNPIFQTDEYVISNIIYSDGVSIACLGNRNYDLNAEKGTYKLALPQNYIALKKYLEKNYPQFDLVFAKNTQECLDLILDGEVDFVAQNVNVLATYLQKPRYEKITVMPEYIMEENLAIIAKNTEENRMLIGIIDKCIASMNDKEMSQIVINNMVTNSYKMTMTDAVYKFRYWIIACVCFVLILCSLLISIFAMKTHNYEQMRLKNEELAIAVAQANNANYAKSEFLARMSHEIRTPMNAIVGLTAICKNYENDPERVDEYLTKIETSSKILLDIINDVLDMSAIESNKIKISNHSFDIENVLDSIQTIYAPQCKQKSINFEMKMEQIVNRKVIGDKLRLNQVLMNLVSNAYKYTPSGGKVSVLVKEVSVRDGKAFYNFSVSDTGPGMNEEELKRLYEPFERDDSEDTQKNGGSGLGLSIAKNMVELMEGEISCQSKKGVGTTFLVSIPLKIAEILEQKEETTISEDDWNPEKYDFTGYKVLVAEDNEMNAEIIEELLNLVHMQIDIAENGKIALEKFAASSKDTYLAILMDIQMPEMNGYEAAKAIRALSHPRANTIPIYAMTANAYTEDVSAAFNAGMSGHMAKPVDTQKLYDTLQQLVDEAKN